jgi:hypothetical protein
MKHYISIPSPKCKPKLAKSSYVPVKVKVKQSLYTPWRRLGGEKV